MKPSAFTLIELVVVLAILAIVTHLAVREMSAYRNSRLGEMAARQLQEVADAVYAREGAEISGFVADMGRYPVGTPIAPDDGNSPVSLRELWELPREADRYAIRPATPANLAAGTDAAIADASVYVPCGWRGPYLRLPLGRSRLLDPWGNPVESPDDAGRPRLVDGATNAVGAGGMVAVLRHFGSDGQPDGEVRPVRPDQRDGEIALTPGGGGCRLFVTASFIDAEGVESSCDGTVVAARWYGPCGGAITGAQARASSPAPIVFEGLTPGPRYVRVSTLAHTGMVRRVMIRPGDNELRERLRLQ